MMGMEMVSKMLVSFDHLTHLVPQEDFIKKLSSRCIGNVE
jgi:hypothetical protein